MFLESNPKPPQAFFELYSPAKKPYLLGKSLLTHYCSNPSKSLRLKKIVTKRTSRARETGKATVRDSARAGESQQTEAKAAAAAANPKSPFPNDTISSWLLRRCVSGSGLCQAHGTINTPRFLVLRRFKHESRWEWQGSEVGFKNLVEIGEQWVGLRSRLRHRGSISGSKMLSVWKL